MPITHPNLTIFSGGSAANSLVDIFESIRLSLDCPLSYIIPISDNGGSSSELIRVFGGPGIGDVRSRLVRLIPRLSQRSPGFREREAIRVLFNYRLSSDDGDEARRCWWGIVDGTSLLWKDISSAKKELIRSILNLVNLEIIKRSRPPGSTFDFSSASVGNLFLTGARLFTGSFESAIYLLGSVCGVNEEEVKVIPSVNSNFSHHIAAGLEDGSVIVGQNAISHPSPVVEKIKARRKRRSTVVNGLVVNGDGTGGESTLQEEIAVIVKRRESVEHYYGDDHVSGNGRNEGEQDDEEVSEEEEEDANLPGTLPTLRTRNINFNKAAHLNEDLPARISRIWYINPYGQEILPPANPRAITAINNAQAIIYSIGSLYTSLAPSLVPRGIGEALRKNTTTSDNTSIRTKILILNGSLDREVGPQPPALGSGGSIFSALEFIEAIIRAGEQSRGIIWEAATDRDRDRNQAINTTNSPLLSTPQQINSNQISSANSNVSTRPGLFTSRSEHITPTLRSQFTQASFSHSQSHSLQARIFPSSPLLASTAPTRSPSRDNSPSPSPTLPTPARIGTTRESAAAATSGANTTTTTPTTTTTTMAIDPIYRSYVTHLIHLPNSSGTPHVDSILLRDRYGIECVEVRAELQMAEEGRSDEGLRYDADALKEAIEQILK